MEIWFLSGEGERHEDHIPHGIFSSLEEIKKVLGEQIEIDESNPNAVTFTSLFDEDTIDFVYTAYCVTLNELSPKILRT